MLSGEGNAGERGKTTIGLISKKATFHMQLTFFVHFFAVVLHDRHVKLPETFYGGNVARFLVHFFPRPLIFTLHGGCWHFSFCYRRYIIFMLFFQQKMSPLFSIYRCRSSSFIFSLSFAGLPPTFSFSLSFSSFTFQICGHDDTDTETISAFRFRLD